MTKEAAAALRRYEVSILIGPCTQAEAEGAMVRATKAVKDLGPGTALNLWDEELEQPGDYVEGVEIISLNESGEIVGF